MDNQKSTGRVFGKERILMEEGRGCPSYFFVFSLVAIGCYCCLIIKNFNNIIINRCQSI